MFEQSSGPDVSLVAPADVMLVWHAHMLSPRNYERDCCAAVGGIVDHRLLSAEDRQAGLPHPLDWFCLLGPHCKYPIGVLIKSQVT
jgi:hypothetical protein